MKLVGDPAAEAWLEALGGAFEWDSGNHSKNAKHQVDPSEVESLLQRTVFLAGRIVEPAHDEPRWLLLGETNAGRRLALIFHATRQQAPAHQLPPHAAEGKEAL
jgi:uncharacterized DUF497 family protein